MRARRIGWLAVAAAVALGGSSAYAVSGGPYDPKKQGCTGDADASDTPDRVEKNCRSLMFSVSDKGGRHTYLSVGVPQVADGENPVQALIVCIDLGLGTKNCYRVSQSGFKNLGKKPGTPAHPNWGKDVYFGADDNLDGGEHDGSEMIANGPSDGGAIDIGTRPSTSSQFLAALTGADRSYILTHPVPGANAGFGACADGICFTVTTERRVAYQGGSDTAEARDVSNYSGVEWDPESCGGPDDQAEDCGGQPISYWHEKNGTTYVEPGIQIYEDPDPQGSPIGPYPLPAIYVGTCGVIIGGADLQMPDSPFTNDAGQIVIPTGC